ncbi:MAG: ribbon-helix-helix domain-containing protein [Blastocatellia bacterium]
MNVDKVTISIESDLLRKIDRLVRANVFPSRSKAIQVAVSEKIERFDRNRLSRECAKLDVKEEQALADEGLASEAAEWQPY